MISLEDKTAEEILGSIKIPPQPEALLKIHRELDKKDPSLSVFTDIIGSDVGISSAVLRIINSSFYGMRSEVNSIHHAISLLGLVHIKNLMATILFRMAMEEDGFTPMPRYWDNATDVARLSSYLARQLGTALPDQAYTAGLFFDCGIPVMAQQYDDFKQDLSQQNQQQLKSYTELEDLQFNTNHSIVGYYVARSWGLPQVIRKACLLHHDIDYIKDDYVGADPTCKNLVIILKIAEHVAGGHRNDADYEWQRYKPYVLDNLGLSEPDYDELKADMIDILNSGEA
jgi:HD-like signal output (HDOD) protein